MAHKINELVEKIKNLSETEYYRIKIEEKSPEITDSKIGGLPYCLEGKEFPTDEEGNKLYLLAQINFEKEKTSAPLPEKGLLQFFIADNDLMGVDYDDQITQTNFRVIYHETVDYAITAESIENQGIPSSEKAEIYPVTGQFKITLTKTRGYTTINDIKFENIFKQAYEEVYGTKLNSKKKYYDILKPEEVDKLEDGLNSDSKSPYHKMLGYAFFTQEDPRYVKKYENYDTLLFQLDSESKYIIWGDLGIANFFIQKKDLEEKNFSNVLYNWDCS
jgi:uncharacterized protein YwqG